MGYKLRIGARSARLYQSRRLVGAGGAAAESFGIRAPPHATPTPPLNGISLPMEGDTAKKLAGLVNSQGPPALGLAAEAGSASPTQTSRYPESLSFYPFGPHRVAAREPCAVTNSPTKARISENLRMCVLCAFLKY